MYNVIETKNLKKYYKRGSETVKALDGVDIGIKSGETLSIVGPSGSGKTTLMNLIGCLDSPTDGYIEINGENITGFSESKLTDIRRRNIGFIFQRFHLMPNLTVKENIELPSAFSKDKINKGKLSDLLERIGLKNKQNLRINMISGGDKQMVSIARALLYDPKVIIADEPTGRLEFKERDMVMSIFRELASSGLAIIIATHDPSIAEESDRIIYIQDGKIVQ